VPGVATRKVRESSGGLAPPRRWRAFLKPNGKKVDKLSACTKTASGYDTPCLQGKEQIGRTKAADDLFAEDTVYFTGNDPIMGRR
jgi:hypothetical protein